MDDLVSKLPEPRMSENAIAVLEKRYFRKDKEGKVIENPKQLFWRVASNIASADGLYGASAQEIEKTAFRFYEVMSRCEFMPNSPTLMNAGKAIQQLSACFVLPIEDSMEGIFDAIKYTALIHQSGGGTGFSFSRLRPHGDLVKSTMGVASGPISFMKVFDAATDVIKQGGTRRGANMGILRVDHPDIMEFIECKRDMTSITNFNISVAATDNFMEAVIEGTDYDILNPRTKQPVGKKNAREVFDKIVENAWHNGDPGIVFIDRMNTERTNPTPAVGMVESTNPCGEQPLLPYESCNLGSVNLAKMLRYNGNVADLDWDRLEYTVKLAARFLDNVIDMNRYPLPQIEQMTRFGNRKIGLGVMGFADMLIELGIPYNSEYAVELAEKVMNFVSDAADEASLELGIKRGPFPNWNKSVFCPNGPKYRNATRTTIAPTGTISIISSASSGIEPLFAVSYVRVTPTYRLVETNPIFERIAKERGFYSAELMEKIASSNTIKNFEEIPEDVRRVFVTAHDITPEWHIRIQAAFQKHTDNAVSKTVNFPNSATIEDVKKVYLMAYELGCKGVTIYRDGSRAVQVLSTKKEEKKEEKKSDELALARPRPRPKAMTGSTREVKTGCGDMYVTINNDENGPFEVFCAMGKSGGCISAYSEAMGRLVSLALRSGVDPKQVVKQLKGIRCSRPVFDTGGITYSCADAISKTVQAHMSPDNTVQAGIASFMTDRPVDTEVKVGDGAVAAAAQQVNSSEDLIKAGLSPECPECGESVDFVEGCVVCHSCGYSACG
jgi:ribonucleoside-diphosphate reductase alpha chain